MAAVINFKAVFDLVSRDANLAMNMQFSRLQIRLIIVLKAKRSRMTANAFPRLTLSNF